MNTAPKLSELIQEMRDLSKRAREGYACWYDPNGWADRLEQLALAPPSGEGVDDPEDALLAAFVEAHDDEERWLDSTGYLYDPHLPTRAGIRAVLATLKQPPARKEHAHNCGVNDAIVHECSCGLNTAPQSAPEE